MIKNIELLNLDPLEEARLEAGAIAHMAHSNIRFEIRTTDTDENVVSVLTTQGYHMSSNYADRDTLFNRTIELFRPFTKEKIILCRVICFDDMVAQN